jgi:hypothetical protein
MVASVRRLRPSRVARKASIGVSIRISALRRRGLTLALHGRSLRLRRSRERGAAEPEYDQCRGNPAFLALQASRLKRPGR